MTLCLCGKGCLDDSSDDALREERDVEINQQSYSFTGQLQVCQELGLMNRQQFLHRFQFQNNFALHQQIDLVTTVQLQPFVVDGQIHLSLKSQFPKAKLVAKALLVSRFQKPRPKVTMDLDGRPENRTRPRVSSLFFLFASVDVNRLDSIVHLTISTQNDEQQQGNQRDEEPRPVTVRD